MGWMTCELFEVDYQYQFQLSSFYVFLLVFLVPFLQVLSDENTRAQYDVRTQFVRKTNASNPTMSPKYYYYHNPEPIRHYRWVNLRMRMRSYQQSRHNPYDEQIQHEAILRENQGTFSGVLRLTFFMFFLTKTVGQFVALTLCLLFSLMDDELDNGYELGYFISWLLGGRSGVMLMLFVRFAGWLCGKNNSGRLVLVVLALWVGVTLARFAPFPQGAVLALLYMSMKMHDD